MEIIMNYNLPIVVRIVWVSVAIIAAVVIAAVVASFMTAALGTDQGIVIGLTNLCSRHLKILFFLNSSSRVKGDRTRILLRENGRIIIDLE